jgi:EmrB/QacA subfamily drug resistance transporter
VRILPASAPAADAPRAHYHRTFAVLALGTLAYTLLQSLVLPALPTFERELHTSEDSVAWILTAYLLSASVATPILGRLGDLKGKERMLVVVFAALSLGSLLGALSSSLALLIVARVIQGVGGAVFPLAFGIIRDEFPPEHVAGGIGLISTILGIGGGLGIVLGGPIVQHLSYHWLFWIPLGMTVIALAATVRFIPESPVRSEGRVNLVAAGLLSGWLVALLLGVSEGANWGWTSAGVLGLLLAAAVLFTVWVRVEWRSDHPLVDMRMMRIPTVWWTNVAAALIGVSMYASIEVLPPFLESARSTGYGFGLSPSVGGLFLVPSSAAMFVTGLSIGRITNWLGPRTPLALGALLGGAPYVLLAFNSSHAWEFLLASAVSGVGIGLAFAAMPNLIVGAVADTETGVATGMNANIRTIGGSVGSEVVATVLATGVVAGVTPLHDYSVAFAILACSSFLAAGAALLLPRRAAQSARPVPV